MIGANYEHQQLPITMRIETALVQASSPVGLASPNLDVTQNPGPNFEVSRVEQALVGLRLPNTTRQVLVPINIASPPLGHNGTDLAHRDDTFSPPAPETPMLSRAQSMPNTLVILLEKGQRPCGCARQGNSSTSMLAINGQFEVTSESIQNSNTAQAKLEASSIGRRQNWRYYEENSGSPPYSLCSASLATPGQFCVADSPCNITPAKNGGYLRLPRYAVYT
ncbi:hypothetical protein DFP72DRAFT_862317 [Ephemerocybe angulata]|uniref:Uncharacterized protein n=1 Tax=Ephemerocybe angulata TaxID=980116 RepID=A0A8H6H8E5_9AGAR|nr:hypothetical protein DFP72DRAFT_862317 [Tulosesus angulatus]